MKRHPLVVYMQIAAVAIALAGCSPSRPFFFFEDGDLSHYKGVATEIEYPDVNTIMLSEVQGAAPPLTLMNQDAREIWNLPMEEAIQTAVSNSKVMRSLGVTVVVTTLAGRAFDPERVLRNPATVASTYGPAIAESDPRLGTEAALSAFDAQLSATSFWEKNDRPVNFFIPGFGQRVFEQDTGAFMSQVAKKSAGGATFYVRQHTNYEWNNNPANVFPSVWTNDIEAEFNQPLLQGAGVQFNRIAGPNASASTLGGNGFYNGVVIARIRQDIALADVEIGVRDLVYEVELAYDRLYFAYRDMDAKIAGRDSALQTWRKIYNLLEAGARGGEAEKEAQAREQYFLFRALVETSLSTVYDSESNLRYLMGIAATDGRLIRPSDEPTTARVEFDWHQIHAEAMARNVELRRQKWTIKQHELQLMAAKNFLMPRLNAVGRYRWRGFGNDLINSTPQPDQFNNAWQTLTDGNFQEWQLGFEFNMPLGFRLPMAAVRNQQLLLARERAILQDQELELSHQLTSAVRALDRYYTLMQTNFNRRVAAQRQVDAVRAAYEAQTVTLDLLLDAQRRLADAEGSYYESVSAYNQAIAQIHYRKGSLLEYDNVYLSEGPWADKAYRDAQRKARQRDAGIYMNYGFSRPNVISAGPVPQVTGTTTGAETSTMLPEGYTPEMVPTPPPTPSNSLQVPGRSANVGPSNGSFSTSDASPLDEGLSILTGSRSASPVGARSIVSRQPGLAAYETVQNRPTAGGYQPATSGSRAEYPVAGQRMSR